MSRNAWLILLFWVVAIGLFLKSCHDSDVRMTEQAKPERHWFPPSMVTPAAAPPSPNADVRMIDYRVHETPGAGTFTADVVVKNFGLKKATDVQVRVVPYHGLGTNSKNLGPDEIDSPDAVDNLATAYQWVSLPDVAPGQTATQTITLSVRSDAEPQTHFTPKVTFGTAP